MVRAKPELGEGCEVAMNEGRPRQLAVVGLGYVGLPLAVAFARHLPTIGFDKDQKRVEELRRGYDRNREVPPEALKTPNLHLTTESVTLREADFIIVAVPTPVDRAKRPDLSHLMEACRLVGQNLRRGTTVVYESTVYPGCTEEVCIPILERESGLKAGVDFKVGYSPERINPGDPEHTLENVVKVVAGQDRETTELLAQVYGLVVKAGIYKAPNIKTAEAAKVIENIQRDLNIALMNELAMLFHRLGLDTREVLEAARTKWNFLPFEPGLVGGHCIPVDPYYLTYKAQEVGYHPEVILAGRRINDGMGRYAAQETIRLLIQAGKEVKNAKVLVLGFTYKENVPDARNTQVIKIVQTLEEYGCDVFVYDPLITLERFKALGIKAISNLFTTSKNWDAIILAVPHNEIRKIGSEKILALLRGPHPVFIDIKGIFNRELGCSSKALFYWKL